MEPSLRGQTSFAGGTWYPGRQVTAWGLSLLGLPLRTGATGATQAWPAAGGGSSGTAHPGDGPGSPSHAFRPWALDGASQESSPALRGRRARKCPRVGRGRPCSGCGCRERDAVAAGVSVGLVGVSGRDTSPAVAADKGPQGHSEPARLPSQVDPLRGPTNRGASRGLRGGSGHWSGSRSRRLWAPLSAR